MILETIAGIFSSGGLAGITGMIAGHLAKIEDRKKAAIDQAHELEMTKLTIMETKLEQSHELAIADKEIDKAETEGEIEIESKEVDAFVASQKNNKNEGGIRWVRPIIAGYLLVLSTYISAVVFKVTGGIESLPAQLQADLLIQIIEYVFYLTTLSVGWFFGARGTSKPK
jgi:hypothetical protein